MTEADRAFKAAENAIEDSRDDGQNELILNGGCFAALERLPATLASICPLTLLEITGTCLSDISALVECRGLRALYLEDAPLFDLSALSGLSGLRGLSLCGTAVRDLSALAGLSHLDWLVLDDCPVRDLGPLAGLTGLKQLSLARTEVADIRPLSGLTGLIRLTLTGSPVQDLAPITGLSGLLADDPAAGLFCADIDVLTGNSDLATAAAIAQTRPRTEAVLAWLRRRPA